MYNLFINTGKELGHINPEIQGHFNINGTEVFISRGVGCGILPFRIFSAPEATVVEICL